MPMRTVLVLWRRELLRITRYRAQLVPTLLGPMLFFLVLGLSLSSLTDDAHGLSVYLTFLFPGILVFAVQAPAVSAGISIVRDREAGLLRGMLVAPVSRSALVIGKCLGGATSAAVQGGLLLGLTALTGISYHPAVLILMFMMLTLICLCVTAIGALGAVVMRHTESFQALVGIVMFPMYLLSGALFRINALPGWLTPLMMVNPLTYAVDAMRWTASIGVADAPLAMRLALPGGGVPPIGLEILAMCFLGVTALGLAAYRFSRTEQV